MLGEKGYKDRLEELAHDRDCTIEGALCRIDEVGGEYAARMQELGRLDGSRIDSGTMALLNSDLKLSNEDWQELANAYKDNYVMTRILRERYDANRPKSEENGLTLGQKNTGLTFVQFGQTPQDRQEIFSRFTGLLRQSCTHKYMLGNGGMDFASRGDYWRYCAKDSIGKMKPFEDENFDNVDADFPVEYAPSRPAIF